MEYDFRVKLYNKEGNMKTVTRDTWVATLKFLSALVITKWSDVCITRVDRKKKK